MLNEMEMKQAAEQQNSAPTKKKPWPKNCPWPVLLCMEGTKIMRN